MRMADIRAARIAGMRTTRSPSPASFAIAGASQSVGRSAYTRASAMIASFADLIETVPVSYREVLKGTLGKVSECASKRASASLTLATLNKHRASNTSWPAFCLGIHEPTIQISSEFKASTPGLVREIHDEWNSYRVHVLDKGIALKAAEVEFLDGLLNLEKIVPDLAKAVTEHYQAHIQPRNKQCTWDYSGGGPVVSGWRDDEAAIAEYKGVLETLPMMVSRVLMLENNKAVKAETIRFKKMAIKESADDSAMAVDSGLDFKVKAAVADALKKQKGKVMEFHLRFLLMTDSSSSLGKRTRREREEEEIGRPFWKEAGLGPASETAWQEAIQVEGERKIKEIESLVRHIRSLKWDYVKPYTYPDLLCNLPYFVQIAVVLERIPDSYRSSLAYRHAVHIGPNVSIPMSLHNKLSVGLKYLYRRKTDLQLLRSAYHDFCQRVRWQVLLDDKLEDDHESFDPDYVVPHKTKEAPPAPRYVEDGLRAGQSLIDDFCRNNNSMPAVVLGRSAVTGGPNPIALRKELSDNNLIVTTTDKNLGLAVISRDWFFSESKKVLLCDSYRPISYENAMMRLKQVATEVEELSLMTTSKQLARFLTYKIPPLNEDGTLKKGTWQIPRFYGIPKIHKNPVKFRPIVPCHSAIQGPAAKVASKLLKPLIDAQPYIIKGTKQFCKQLSELKLSPGFKYYLISADIVGYYPNLPIKESIEICLSSELPPSKTVHDIPAFLRKCLELSLEGLILQFDGVIYEQVLGIAMGIAVCPDVANLYGAHYENVFMSNVNYIKVPYYGRYIDDIFAIVAGSSEQDALSYAKSVIKFPKMELEWTISERNVPFLDCNVFLDPRSNRIGWTPYRKARNSFERIPWISHHPFDVKRGTFVGEMSRLAVLCSSPDSYVIELYKLSLIYAARGYPPDLLKNWLTKNIQPRWNDRFSNRSSEGDIESPGLFVLKSYFNEVWDKFSIHDLGKTIKDKWADGLAQLDSTGNPGNIRDIRNLRFLERRWLVSRKRTTNLADVCNNVKASFQTFVEDFDPTYGSMDIEIDNDYLPVINPQEVFSANITENDLYTTIMDEFDDY
jgi:hypothetical protein